MDRKQQLQIREAMEMASSIPVKDPRVKLYVTLLGGAAAAGAAVLKNFLDCLEDNPADKF